MLVCRRPGMHTAANPMKTPETPGWKTRLFGDTRFNFYGWIISGILILGGSLWVVIVALRAGASRYPSNLLLLAIYFMLMGHFCLALQNYVARVASALDSKRPREEEPPAN